MNKLENKYWVFYHFTTKKIQHNTGSCSFLCWGTEAGSFGNFNLCSYQIGRVVLVINDHVVSDTRLQWIIYKGFKRTIVVLGGKQMNIITIANTTSNSWKKSNKNFVDLNTVWLLSWIVWNVLLWYRIIF